MKSQRALTLLACTLLVLLPFGLSDFWIFIAIEVLAFALYALSFNLLLGFGGMLSFGHAAFFGVGAYSAAIFFKRSGLDVVWMFTLFLGASLRHLLFDAHLRLPDAAVHRGAEGLGSDRR